MVFVVLLGTVFYSALIEYVAGRIILPAMGLSAPAYWTWFWFMAVVVVLGIPLWFVKEVIR